MLLDYNTSWHTVAQEAIKPRSHRVHVCELVRVCLCLCVWSHRRMDGISLHRFRQQTHTALISLAKHKQLLLMQNYWLVTNRPERTPRHTTHRKDLITIKSYKIKFILKFDQLINVHLSAFSF